MRISARAATAAWLMMLAVPATMSAQDSQCRLIRFRANFRTNGAQQYLELADKAPTEDSKRGPANNALRVLREAAAGGGVDQFTLWYLFGKAYLLLGDMRGLDSSFTRASALTQGDAGCDGEIQRQRRNLWVPLQRLAVDLIQAQQYDTALAVLRLSNVVYRDDPSSYMNMGSVFLSQEKPDSAVAAFRAASHAGTSADRAEVRERAALLVPQLLQRNSQFAEAEQAWREYITLKPRDIAARGSLATVLVALHRSQDAAAVYDSILGQSATLDPLSIFGLGASLFRLAQTDSVNRTSWFRSAARAYEAGLGKSPYDREGLFYASNLFLVLNDTARLQAHAARLVAVDSMNRRSLSLLAQAYQMAGQRNDVVRILLRRDSLPFEVNVIRFAPNDSTASIRGGVQNLRNREMPEFPLAIEFLNGRGEVVATERTPIGPLNAAGSPGSSYDFTLQASGRGIIAYRYKIGG